jgi:hypothetical protein
VVILIAIGGIACFLAFLGVLPWLVREAEITRKARTDYQLCRGTQHVRQLRAAIVRHRSATKRIREKQQDIEQQLQNLGKYETLELHKALCTYIVQTRLTEVAGVGKRLKERIITTCFDGTLESLRRASVVRGVGQEKMMAINIWINQVRDELPFLLKHDFPGKGEIKKKYSEQRRQLNKSLEPVKKTCEEATKLLAIAESKLKKLEQVGVADFRRALHGDAVAAKRVGLYSQGAFAEWEPVPAWYREIISAKYEEE